MEPGTEALAILRRSLQRAQGFALFFAVVESPAARERWITRLRTDRPDYPFLPVRFVPDAEDLLTQVRSACAAAPALAPDTPLLLVDLERLVPHEAAPLAPLHNLNLQRQAWREELLRPVVFWIAPYLAALIARAAPDFFDWRRELLEFPPEPDLPGNAVENSSDLGSFSGRSSDDYQRRLSELDARLTHVESPSRTRARWLSERASLLAMIGEKPAAETAADAAREAWLELGENSEALWSELAYARALLQVGDSRGALQHAESACRLAQKQADEASEHANTLRDISVSLERLGDIHFALGRLDLALAAFEQAKTIAEHLATSDPNNFSWQRYLSVFLARIGDVHVSQGRLEVALTTFEQAKAIHERLAASYPHNSIGQRDLSISLIKLSDIHIAQGRLDLALATIEQAKAIVERLAASDPHNAARQRDLSVSLDRLGNIHVTQGRIDLALATFEQAKTIAERLAASDPHNTAWQRDLQISHERLAKVLARQGKPVEAEAQSRAALAIARRLVAHAPENTQFLVSLIGSLAQFAIALAGRSEPAALAEARALFTEAIALHERLAAAGTFTDQRQLTWGDELRASLAALS